VAAKKASQALPTQLKTLKARKRVACVGIAVFVCAPARPDDRCRAVELAQFASVQQHPAFIAEPFGSIHEHLRNLVQKQQVRPRCLPPARCV
jgi:hypothetical protein